MSSREPVILGIDTSNYTTSAARLEGGEIFQSKKLLPVKPGQLGLRQSDAVFHHVQQLPDRLEEVLQGAPAVQAIGVSDRPRAQEGSYMPCFTVGVGTARALAAATGAALYRFSHQAGHIAAALYSAKKLDLLEQRFLAFHVSGGTTEAVLVTPDENEILHAEIVASSLDLKGGQAVDRAGVLLGLPFPAGPELEKLALCWDAPVKVRPVMKGCNCSFSGIENQCKKLFDTGHPKEEIARYCLEAVRAALEGMCTELLGEYGNLPVLFAGGVMSNSIVKKALTEKFGAYFAEPVFSADNAAGAAVLAARREGVL